MFATKALFKRSVWKGPSIFPMTIPKAEPGKAMPPIRTHARSATILPNFVGMRFQIHNGKVYYEVQITEDMVGHKLGEFSPWVSATRKRFTYKQSRNK